MEAVQHRTATIVARALPLCLGRIAGVVFGAATKALENRQYGRCAEHFLGKPPKTIAGRHCTHKNGEELDAAIRWFGDQFGVEWSRLQSGTRKAPFEPRPPC